jgi:hypothetical protein
MSLEFNAVMVPMDDLVDAAALVLELFLPESHTYYTSQDIYVWFYNVPRTRSFYLPERFVFDALPSSQPGRFVLKKCGGEILFTLKLNGMQLNNLLQLPNLTSLELQIVWIIDPLKWVILRTRYVMGHFTHGPDLALRPIQYLVYFSTECTTVGVKLLFHISFLPGLSRQSK